MDCDSNREQLNEIFQLLKSHANIVSVSPTEHFHVQEDGRYKSLWWKCTSNCVGLKSFYGCPHLHLCSVFRHLLPVTCFCVGCEFLAVTWEFRLCQAATNSISAVCAPVPSQHSPAGASGSPASMQVKAGKAWVQGLSTPWWQRGNTDRCQFSSDTGENGRWILQLPHSDLDFVVFFYPLLIITGYLY